MNFNWNRMPDVNRPTQVKGPKHGPKTFENHNDLRMWSFTKDAGLVRIKQGEEDNART